MARLLHTAALRLRKHTQRHGAFQAWNKCLGHLLSSTSAPGYHGQLRAKLRVWHLRRYRVARLLHTAALRLRKHTQRHGAFQAWNKCLGHLLALSRAHMESIMYSHFSLAVQRCSDPDSRKSLKVQPPCRCCGCICCKSIEQSSARAHMESIMYSHFSRAPLQRP